ncbi:uncharacterized protein LOC126993921 [Eriocheir sinensis]|uniref:uncharacterized protein LOC126993921 n=1 Tax=Eriocheir sinensis TaxID=95602 RepID=UPI0021C61CF0|nr:uncharacterized protein LOC126993921 [Eriocheir sinensis]
MQQWVCSVKIYKTVQQCRVTGEREETGGTKCSNNNSGCRVRQGVGLNVYYTNSRSIRNKTDLLRGKAWVEKFDMIAITESWINTADRHFLPELEIEGYKLFHQDRIGRKGGGVALFIRDNLKCVINNSIKEDSNTESLWVETIGRKEKLVIGVLYRPPNLTRDSSQPLLQEISGASRYRNVCVIGDFNYRNIEWDTLSGDQEAQDLLDVIQDSFLKQLIRTPTREENILDLLLTNREDIISNIEVGDSLGNSDHKEIRFNIKWEDRVSSNNTLIPDFRKADHEGLRKQLQRLRGVRSEVGQDPKQGGALISGEVTSQVSSLEGEYNSLVREIKLGQKQFIPHREVRSTCNYPR